MNRGRALSAADALALRLAGQGLDRRAPRARLVDACGAMAGAQAQVGSAARLSLGARVAGVTDDVVRRAVEERKTLVKTWTVRGTLHLVPARDLATFVGALGPVRRGYATSWLARHGVGAKALEALTVDIVEALADGPLNRRQVAARVGDAHGEKARRLLENSWGGVFHLATSHGLVVFGPPVDGQTTFVRVDRWLGAPLPAVDRAAAEAEIARRFVRAYGPATVRDFAYWAGVYAPEAQRMWGRIEGELRAVTVDGAPAFVHASAPRPAGGGDGPHVRLLPHFDTFLLGHRDKAACLEPGRYKRVFRSAGWISPVVLVDGRVAGTWEIERKGEQAIARVRTFRPLSPAERAGIAGEAAALGAFVGARGLVRYGRTAKRRVKAAWNAP